MNVNLYICTLAGISIVFYLMYPNDATFGSSMLTSVMTSDMTAISLLNIAAAQVSTVWGTLIVVGIFAGAIATYFGASAVLGIVWNIMIFFIIPNMFLLPTHLLFSTDVLAGLPVELKLLIVFLMNTMLLMVAIEFWK